MADEKDEIVQKVKIVVDDSELAKLNKASVETKKIVANAQKNLNATTDVGFSRIKTEATAAAKATNGLTTAVTGLNAVSGLAVAKSIKATAAATKDHAAEIKQATVAQKELNKATTAFVVPDDRRDKATGRFLPRGSKPSPQLPVEPPAASTVAAKVPLQRDPNTGRILPRGVQAPPRIEKPVERFRDPVTGRLLPRTQFGPPEFQGPRQPFGPPEAQGPRLPRFLPGDTRFIGPRRPDGPPELQGPRRPPLPTDRNFVGPREFVGPRLPGTPPPIPTNPVLALTAVFAGVAGGAAALAAAVAAVGLAFEKAGDTVAKTSERLSSFTGGKEEGKEAFAGLQKLGNELKVSAVELAKPFEQLVRSGQDTKGAENILRNFTKGFQAEGISEDAGNNSLTKLLANVRENGFLSGEELKAFKDFAPKTGEALQRSIEKAEPGAVSKGIISSQTVQKAAGSAEFGKDAADRLANAGEVTKRIEKSFTELSAAGERLAQAVSTGNAISGTISKAASTLDGVAAAIEKLSPVTEKIFSAAQKVAATAFRGPAGLVTDAATSLFGGGTDETKKKEEADVAAAKKVAEAGAAAKQEKEGSVQKKLALDAARLSRQQAGIAKDFLPQEQESQTAQNKLNVERADISVRQAQLGLQDAQKQKELAAFAPGDARLRTDQAANTLEQIQLQQRAVALRRNGIDPATDPDQQRLVARANQDALDIQEKSAQRALARAKVEEKFASLEPKKAQLAGEQAITALRSAEIEKRDTSLKLAKDERGQPIDRDLAALRYAQAQLDEEKKATSLLSEILAAVKGGGAGKSSDGRSALETAPRTSTNTPINDSGPKQIFPDKNGNFPPPTGFENDPLFQKRSDLNGTPINGTPINGVPVDGLNQFASALTNATNTTENAAKAQEFQSNTVIDAGTATGDVEKSFSSLPAPLDSTAGAANASSDALNDMAKNLKKMGFDPVFVGGDNSTVSAATGGLLNGPGTGTSDSILARVSKGEYIVKAAATKHWGVDFLHSINRMRTPRFNMGGLVGLMSPKVPRFASGGLAGDAISAGTVSALGSVDLRTDHGSVTVMANSDAVKQLQKMAVTKRMTSTGRKPGFVG